MTTEGNTSGAVNPHAQISREELRQQIVLTMVEAVRKAKQEGKQHLIVLMEQYPDVPGDVHFEVETILRREADEAWWLSMERTIPAEIINGVIRAKDQGASE